MNIEFVLHKQAIKGILKICLKKVDYFVYLLLFRYLRNWVRYTRSELFRLIFFYVFSLEISPILMKLRKKYLCSEWNILRFLFHCFSHIKYINQTYGHMSFVPTRADFLCVLAPQDPSTFQYISVDCCLACFFFSICVTTNFWIKREPNTWPSTYVPVTNCSFP